MAALRGSIRLGAASTQRSSVASAASGSPAASCAAARPAANAGVSGLGGDCLGEAGHGVGGAPELQHQDAEQCLGGGVVAVEHDGFGGVARGAFDVAGLPAQFGAALAQAGMVRRGCDGLVEFERPLIGVFARSASRALMSATPMRSGRQAPRRGEQRPRGADAARGDQLRGPLGQGFGVGGGVQFLHGGPSWADVGDRYPGRTARPTDDTCGAMITAAAALRAAGQAGGEVLVDRDQEAEIRRGRGPSRAAPSGRRK